MSTSRPRVLLADDHPLMLAGLCKLLEPECEIVGVVTEAAAFLEAACRQQPDLAIIDISMPGIDGIEATRRLRSNGSKTRVVILSVHTEPAWVRAAFAAGAWGYVCKSSAPEEIELALREVLSGHFYLSPIVARAVVPAAEPIPWPEAIPSHAATSPPAGDPLTPREQEIVRLVGQGLGNKEIGHRLGVSVATVRTHLSRVYEKVGSASRVELALLVAQSHGAVM